MRQQQKNLNIHRKSDGQMFALNIIYILVTVSSYMSMYIVLCSVHAYCLIEILQSRGAAFYFQMYQDKTFLLKSPR